MKYILKNLCIPVQSEQNILSQLCSVLSIQSCSILSWQIIRKALDTRKKNYPIFVYTIELDIDNPGLIHKDITPLHTSDEAICTATKLNDIHPFIIGMGPAGLFCALAMVENGLKPILFDRGDDLELRSAKVNRFWSDGILDNESNVQFGEGGAGAFSDGKLTSRTANSITNRVFDWLIRFGANESIKWEAHPHLGTDVIRSVVKDIRAYLITKGCKFCYNSALTGISLNQSKLESVRISNELYTPEIVILAPGNAARDSFRMLNRQGVAMEPKSIAMGFRISHSQEWINQVIYGSDKWAETLGAASYRLTSQSNGKGTYTFCMCPGGHIIAASSENNTAVTNGMSFAARNHTHGNSAIVTQFDASDYGCGLWDGMNLQLAIERNAFIDKYAAPYQYADDYMKGVLSGQAGYHELFASMKAFQISELFSFQINQSLKNGLKHFDRILPGFIRGGLLIAPETRTSSPVRIVRDKLHGHCLNISNLYAIGEGSGYAGGIVSSAADGLKTGSGFYY